jgi:hypothetical protein
VYKKGTDNRVVDALSRHPSPIAQLCMLFCPTHEWLNSMQESYINNSKAQQMLPALAVDPQAVPHFSLANGILRYKHRICVGNNKALQQQNFQALHPSVVGGHSGFPVTYRRMKQLFAWSEMKIDTLSLVKACTVCQQAKPNRSKYPGLLSPLPIPDGAWQTISLDFIEGLPRSGSANCILVV